jgi:general secretion pathway protein G
MFRTQIRDARDEGFTLIELLIVIIVLGILAGIVVFGVSTFRADATTAACKADVKSVQVAAEAYNAKNGGYAPDVPTLVTGGYLKTSPTDVTYTVTAGALSVVGIPVGC